MDKIYWIEENGAERFLSYGENYLVENMAGHYMPPVNLVEEEVPFQSVTRIRAVKIKARDVDVQLVIKADSEANLRKSIRETIRMLNPLKKGKLKVISADGSQRELHCQYIAGLEGNGNMDSDGFYMITVILVFHAFDPYWYDTNTIVETFRLNESPGLFFPVPPVRLVSSTVFADITINNSGDVEAFPEWIITGPGEGIVLENMTTGETTELDSSLGIGESITINTKPFYKTVTRNDGLNLYVDLSDNSSLWSLQDGINNIRIQMSNATELSSVQISYKNRYLGV